MPTRSSQNALLRSLSRAESARVGPLIHRSDVRAGDVLLDTGAPATTVVFPETCLITVYRTFLDGTHLAATAVGCEGVVGLIPAFSGVQNALLRHVVQIEGRASFMDIAEFMSALDELPGMRRQMLAYAGRFMGDLLTAITCARNHQVEPRLARALLMMADRVSSNVLPLTHATLADLLAVQRPTLTAAVGGLEGQGLIRSHRGRVEIVDRRGLQDAACPCYSVSHALNPVRC